MPTGFSRDCGVDAEGVPDGLFGILRIGADVQGGHAQLWKIAPKCLAVQRESWAVGLRTDVHRSRERLTFTRAQTWEATVPRRKRERGAVVERARAPAGCPLGRARVALGSHPWQRPADACRCALNGGVPHRHSRAQAADRPPLCFRQVDQPDDRSMRRVRHCMRGFGRAGAAGRTRQTERSSPPAAPSSGRCSPVSRRLSSGRYAPLRIGGQRARARALASPLGSPRTSRGPPLDSLSLFCGACGRRASHTLSCVATHAQPRSWRDGLSALLAPSMVERHPFDIFVAGVSLARCCSDGPGLVCILAGEVCACMR